MTAIDAIVDRTNQSTNKVMMNEVIRRIKPSRPTLLRGRAYLLDEVSNVLAHSGAVAALQGKVIRMRYEAQSGVLHAVHSSFKLTDAGETVCGAHNEALGLRGGEHSVVVATQHPAAAPAKRVGDCNQTFGSRNLIESTSCDGSSGG